MRGRDKFRKYRGFINLLVKICFVFPKSIRMKMLDSSRGIKGNKGILIRYVLLKTLAQHIGENVSIHDNVLLKHVEKLSIGNNVSIHPFSYIDSVGTVTIGNDVSIAEGTSIISFNHRFDDLSIPIKDQGIHKKPIEIQDDVWVGAKATILCNVTIAKGAIVGAGAVVTKSTYAYSIVCGVPAKEIANRKTALEKAKDC